MEEKVKEVLNLIRPSLQNDGGDVEFISLKDKKVTVKLTGHCAGCAFSQMTLKNGIEKLLREQVDPEILVENATI